jgi:hypothetical protein
VHLSLTLRSPPKVEVTAHWDHHLCRATVRSWPVMWAALPGLTVAHSTPGICFCLLCTTQSSTTATEGDQHQTAHKLPHQTITLAAFILLGSLCFIMRPRRLVVSRQKHCI